MHSMQRQFGRLWNKGPGDNAKVAFLLKDYEDADDALAKIVDNAKMWRDSWAAVASHQLQVVTEYEALYDPIVGATDGQTVRRAAQTPELQLNRTFGLKKAYAELSAELTVEVALIEDHVIKPAADARGCIAPIRKTIKKRDDKRLDYEKTQEKALKLQRKPGRTPKEDAALAKADAEMSRAADEFRIADEHLRATLPPIINASFNLVAPLLSNLVLVQNRLLGLYYTTLHGYCEEYGFPSPPPPMQDVIDTWNAACSPIRSQIESISFIARGKAIHQPTTSGNSPSSRLAQPPTGGIRRTSTGLTPGAKPRALRAPFFPLDDHTSSPGPSPRSSYKPPDYANATEFTTATILGGAAVSRSTGAGLGQQQPSALAQYTTSNGLGKKKPPPPPPPKRPAAAKPEEWVVALYPFAGQGSGDLSFQEGARIRVVKRTETEQDWWVGELDGVKGNFPANYCKPA